MRALKERIKSYKKASGPAKKTMYYFALFSWRMASRTVRFLLNPEYRSLMRIKYLEKDRVHQISNYTEFDRYPDLFEKCRQLVGKSPSPNILSFGCSTGEEAWSLRRYFPQAFILGVDINQRSIKTANRRNNDPDIIFSSDIEKALSEHGPFDIVFALAVLQRSENRSEDASDSSKTYPFSRFESQIAVLDKHLKKGGIFVIDHADYLFEDTRTCGKYHALHGDHNIVRDRYLYDKNSRKMATPMLLHRIFLKRSD